MVPYATQYVRVQGYRAPIYDVWLAMHLNEVNGAWWAYLGSNQRPPRYYIGTL